MEPIDVRKMVAATLAAACVQKTSEPTEEFAVGVYLLTLNELTKRYDDEGKALHGRLI